ncbi:hypothetical protein ILYODFUR_038147 [Ilyodon furcidens]|uniref:Uncharacterized protein n=1 Tax=Ilyodon furcidens TaxID=33524 RepID=A0ABV0T3N5_9TELE
MQPLRLTSGSASALRQYAGAVNVCSLYFWDSEADRFGETELQLKTINSLYGEEQPPLNPRRHELDNQSTFDSRLLAVTTFYFRY